MTRSVIRFGIVALSLVTLAGWLLGFVWPSQPERYALLVSGAVAVAVQAVAFVLVRIATPGDIMASFAVGMLLRLVALGLFFWLGVRVLALPAAPALFGMVTYFFVTSLAEPLLLSR
jgi:hypothetical protein